MYTATARPAAPRRLFRKTTEFTVNVALIENGEPARLVSRRGELEAEAHYSERVDPGLVWMSLHFAQAKVNWLTHDVGDALIGTPEYKVSAVRVERVSTAAANGR